MVHLRVHVVVHDRCTAAMQKGCTMRQRGEQPRRPTIPFNGAQSRGRCTKPAAAEPSRAAGSLAGRRRCMAARDVECMAVRPALAGLRASATAITAMVSIRKRRRCGFGRCAT